MKQVASINSKKVDQQTVDLLKEFLTKAEAGELQSLIYVGKYHDGAVGNGWAGQPDKRMIGEIEDIKFNFFSQAYFPMIDE